MHIVSDKSLQRSDYIYNEQDIGYYADAEPYIKWKHIDGPLLVCRNGAMHWLTWSDRLKFALGCADIYSLERKYLY